jgi:hypothetical protein
MKLRDVRQLDSAPMCHGRRWRIVTNTNSHGRGAEMLGKER